MQSEKPGSPRPQRPPTIQDVATRAGVSISTVSRVLTGSAPVDPARAERVRSAVRALQYQPNRAARTLAGSPSALIGVLIPDLQNPFFREIVRGVEEVTRRHEYLVVLCSYLDAAQRQRKYIELLVSESVAGATRRCASFGSAASRSWPWASGCRTRPSTPCSLTMPRPRPTRWPT